MNSRLTKHKTIKLEKMKNLDNLRKYCRVRDNLEIFKFRKSSFRDRIKTIVISTVLEFEYKFTHI